MQLRWAGGTCVSPQLVHVLRGSVWSPLPLKPHIFHIELGSQVLPLKPSLDLTWLHPSLCHLLERPDKGAAASYLLARSRHPPLVAGSAWEGKSALNLCENSCVSSESLHTPDKPFVRTTCTI